VLRGSAVASAVRAVGLNSGTEHDPERAMGGGSYYQASRAGGNGKSNKWDCGPTAPSITVSFMLQIGRA
ncbi:hypothetical protein Q604_UNBC05164G0001, partial [human gut metagenome]